ncbi:MAG TPA: protein kinase [Kofleriaceae bacterium]|jgi:serine/threonine-protein kinase
MPEHDETRDDRPTSPDREMTVDIDDAPLDLGAERYEYREILGKGGMGEVRLCKDSRIMREVAMKVLRGPLRDDAELRVRFLREARVQGQLEHPAIVPVHDLGTAPDGAPFFTMKRVRGETLRTAIKALRAGDRSRYSRRRLLTAFSTVCLAVELAHRRGVVHRDLKPDNVMLGDFGEVYVLDWGIAKVLHRPDLPIGDDTGVELPPGGTPTRVGAVLGTPRYMAPEQQTGEASPASDIYALGVILHEIVICDASLELPPELLAIAEAATARLLEKRTQSPRELHDAIEKFLDGDRDLEARRLAAEEKAIRADKQLVYGGADITPEVRAQIARDVGAALGLDPTNSRALRALTGLLSRVPDKLPPEAVADMEARHRERVSRALSNAAFTTWSILLLIPMFIWMGVREPFVLIAYAGCVVAAGGFQWAARYGRYQPSLFVAAFLSLMIAVSLLSRSLGLIGIMPTIFAMLTVIFRINVATTKHGLMILAGTMLGVLVPLLLMWTGVTAPLYELHDNVLSITAHLHDLPPTATQFYLVVTTIGALGVASIFGRIYVAELRRADERNAFHTWQLQQLLPPA